MTEKEKDFNFNDLFFPLTTNKALVFFIIVGVIVFGNGLFNSFVGDDKPLVVDNPSIQHLQNFPMFFSGSIFYAGEGSKLGGFSYRPLQTIVFSGIYSMTGTEVPNQDNAKKHLFRTLHQQMPHLIPALFFLLCPNKYHQLRTEDCFFPYLTRLIVFGRNQVRL